MAGSTLERAHGRWFEILHEFGLAPFLSGKHGPCPLCGGTDRFRYTNRNGEGDYYCSQCGPGRGMQLLMKLKKWDFKTAADEVDKIIGHAIDLKPDVAEAKQKFPNRFHLRRLWLESVQATKYDPVGCYLASRGIIAIPKGIRFVREIRHPSGAETAGMLALFTAPDGRASSLHRTFLHGDGTKFRVDPVRALMPGAVAKGGAVRLAPAAEVLGIAEGIETALSASVLFDLPVWAALTEVLLQQWEPPPEAKHIVIFGDGDGNFVGQYASYFLAKRLYRKGLKVEVRIPDAIGEDWNDVLVRSGAFPLG